MRTLSVGKKVEIVLPRFTPTPGEDLSDQEPPDLYIISSRSLSKRVKVVGLLPTYTFVLQCLIRFTENKKTKSDLT